MFHTLVIGGGPQGIQVFRALQENPALDGASLALVDPHLEPATAFRSRLANVHFGQTDATLLTPAMYNVDVPHPRSILDHHPGSLRDHPRVVDFFSHLDDLFESRVRAHHIPTWASGLKRERTEFAVSTSFGKIRAQHVVLAPGAAKPLWPVWARDLQDRKPHKIAHVLDTEFDFGRLPQGGKIAVLGSGMNALLTGHTLSRIHGDQITVFTGKKDVTKTRPDSLLESLRKNLESLSFNNPFRQMLLGLSFTTALPELTRAVLQAHQSGAIHLVNTDFTSEDSEHFNFVILATGFEQKRPGGKLVDSAIANLGLKVDARGFPVLNRHLEWLESASGRGSGIYVTGPLAESRLGFAAPFLVGGMEAARLIGKRIGENSKNTPPAPPNPWSPYHDAGDLQGSKAGKLLRDLSDQLKIWKPCDRINGPDETGATQMANFITGGLVPIATRLPLNGQDGIIQDFVPLKGDLSDLEELVNKKKLNEKQIAQFVIHLITDWILANYDTHSGNFGMDHKGNIIAFDKGQAYKFVRGQDFTSPYAGNFLEPHALSPEVYTKPVSNRDLPVYKILFGRDSTLWSRINPDHSLIEQALQRIESVTRSQITDWMGEFARVVYGENENHLIDEIFYRTQGIRHHFKSFIEANT